MVMSPTILSLFYPVTATTVVCCILMQILCVVSQKASASGGLHLPDPLPGLHPWTLLGDFHPTAPSLLLCPPNNPVKSTPLIDTHTTFSLCTGVL